MAELRPGVEDLVGPARLGRVLAAYPAIGPFEILRDGLSPNSLACAFRTAAGDFVAKGTRPGRKAPGWLAREHQVMRHAAAAGLPVPQPLSSAGGSTIATLDGVDWAVFDAARGEDRYKEASVFEPFETPEEAFSAGAALARLHLALRDFELPARPFFGPVAQCELVFSRDLERDFDRLCQVAAGKMPALPGSPEALRLFAAMRPGGATFGVPPASGVIHGDWIKRNLFFDGSDVAAILDFDLCNRGPWVFDLALAISALAYPWPPLQAGREPHVTQGERLQAGYEAVRALTAAERQLLPALLPVCRFEFHLSLALDALGHGDEAQAKWFWDGQVASLRWWYDRR
jgi:Ser/Thr protein kinase RdoA (MazF antagonist)